MAKSKKKHPSSDEGCQKKNRPCPTTKEKSGLTSALSFQGEEGMGLALAKADIIIATREELEVRVVFLVIGLA